MPRSRLLLIVAVAFFVACVFGLASIAVPRKAGGWRASVAEASYAVWPEGAIACCLSSHNPGQPALYLSWGQVETHVQFDRQGSRLVAARVEILPPRFRAYLWRPLRVLGLVDGPRPEQGRDGWRIEAPCELAVDALVRLGPGAFLARGLDGDGRAWIERWEIEAAPGGIDWVQPGDDLPLGQVVEDPELRWRVVGGTYRCPSQREAPTLRRVWRRPAPPPWTMVEADLAGRSLVAVDDRARLVQVDLEAPDGEAEVLAELDRPPADVSAGAAASLQVGRWPGSCGASMLLDCGDGRVVFIDDPDGDGRFERVEPMTRAQWFASELDEVDVSCTADGSLTLVLPW